MLLLLDNIFIRCIASSIDCNSVIFYIRHTIDWAASTTQTYGPNRHIFYVYILIMTVHYVYMYMYVSFHNSSNIIKLNGQNYVMQIGNGTRNDEV